MRFQERGFKQIFEQLTQWSNLKERSLDDGTRLIGHVPHAAPEAWLHIIYAPLKVAEIKDLESQIGIPIPEEYQDFLSISNGLKIFCDTLSFDGKVDSLERSSGRRRPYNIIAPNTIERVSDAGENFFFFGGYSWDGSLLYFDQGKIYRCSNESSEPLNSWKNLRVMLDSEISRIARLFGPNGREKDPEAPLTPDLL